MCQKLSFLISALLCTFSLPILFTCAFSVLPCQEAIYIAIKTKSFWFIWSSLLFFNVFFLTSLSFSLLCETIFFCILSWVTAHYFYSSLYKHYSTFIFYFNNLENNFCMTWTLNFYEDIVYESTVSILVMVLCVFEKVGYTHWLQVSICIHWIVNFA